MCSCNGDQPACQGDNISGFPNCDCDCSACATECEWNFAAENTIDCGNIFCYTQPCGCQSSVAPLSEESLDKKNGKFPLMPLSEITYPDKNNDLVTMTIDRKDSFVFEDTVHHFFHYLQKNESDNYLKSLTKWIKLSKNECMLLMNTVIRLCINYRFDKLFNEIIVILNEDFIYGDVEPTNDAISYELNIYLQNISLRILSISKYSDDINNYNFNELFDLFSGYLLFMFSKYKPNIIWGVVGEIYNQYSLTKKFYTLADLKSLPLK